MTRYRKWNYISQNFLLSKTNSYSIKDIPLVKNIVLVAGHYQLNSLFAEHGLIFNDLFFQMPLINIRVHGKRRKSTAFLKSQINFNGCWPIIDKLVNVTFPALEDFEPFKITKNSKKISSYTFQFRKYFDYYDSSRFISDRLLHKKDVFFPMIININLNSSYKHYINESYFRILRLPFLFFRYNKQNLWKNV